MTISAPLNEPLHLDESQLATGYSQVLSQVANDQRPVIVQRDGIALAVVVPVEYLDLIRDSLARQQAEQLTQQLDWTTLAACSPPPQSWFDEDEPKPF